MSALRTKWIYKWIYQKANEKWMRHANAIFLIVHKQTEFTTRPLSILWYKNVFKKKKYIQYSKCNLFGTCDKSVYSFFCLRHVNFLLKFFVFFGCNGSSLLVQKKIVLSVLEETWSVKKMTEMDKNKATKIEYDEICLSSCASLVKKIINGIFFSFHVQGLTWFLFVRAFHVYQSKMNSQKEK